VLCLFAFSLALDGVVMKMSFREADVWALSLRRAKNLISVEELLKFNGLSVQLNATDSTCVWRGCHDVTVAIVGKIQERRRT
jgi:hypothetical protein